MSPIRKIIVSLLAACMILGCSSSPDDLAGRLEASSLPAEVKIDRYYSSGLGIDHHYLWRLGALDSSSFIDFMSVVGASEQAQRATSGCLALSESGAPAWWPAVELEDALWDYTKPPYKLYVKALSDRNKACIFRNELRLMTYVQVFST